MCKAIERYVELLKQSTNDRSEVDLLKMTCVITPIAK